MKKIYNDCNKEIKAVQTDNGSEFKGNFLKYLEKKNIPLKHGAPYKPTSQGAVQRFNQTIQKQLDVAFKNSTAETPFNLANQIANIMNLYNNQ